MRHGAPLESRAGVRARRRVRGASEDVGRGRDYSCPTTAERRRRGSSARTRREPGPACAAPPP
ncbi:hypothetical protein C884_00033 [Kocuria palustris PEL]|uniref:Uncharacterized protein n=1 Tax=Kocuria palustris PEL TaxID=1236550 RepID=M2XYH7_9MICC|nr:hypothetical protein C884_00033 [Kocuria palustris PEL]